MVPGGGNVNYLEGDFTARWIKNHFDAVRGHKKYFAVLYYQLLREIGKLRPKNSTPYLLYV